MSLLEELSSIFGRTQPSTSSPSTSQHFPSLPQSSFLFTKEAKLQKFSLQVNKKRLRSDKKRSEAKIAV
jgi:hypothetical protein